MKKRLIFDVDDTLIPWEKEYYKILKKTLKQNNIKLGIFRFIKTLKAIELYENTHERWNVEEVKETLAKVTKIDIDDEKVLFFSEWLKNCVINKASKELHDVLKYLQKKYELVILSNSIKEIQEERLKRFGIHKYFTKIYCGDEVMKPNPKSYKKAMGKNKPSECVIIGDNLNFDVITPSELGIMPIYVNKKKHQKYLTIKDVCELKEIL